MACTIQQFCCCCSLKTGMIYVCTVYVIYFGISSYARPEPRVLFPDTSLELYSSRLYWYGGFVVGVLAMFGVLWSKRFLLLPLMVYEACLFTFRIETLGNIFLSNISVDERKINKEILLLVLQLYVIMLEYSYYRESLLDQNNVFMQPVQTHIDCHQPIPGAPPSAPCVVDVPVCDQFNGTPYPAEYSVQAPYVKPSWDNRMYAAPVPQVYPPYPGGYVPHPTMPGGQATLQPFPHGAPPPYTENPPPYTPPS